MNLKYNFRILFLVFSVSLFLSAIPLYANEVGNPSFETAIGGSSNWDDTANRGITRVTASDAPDGTSYLRLDEAGIGGVELFTFTFQIIGSEVHPGDYVFVSGFARQTPDDGNDEAQIRIEFQDENSVFIEDATDGLTAGVAVPDFTELGVGQRAPEGTNKIVITLRIQNGEAGVGTADFDDIELSINGFPIDLGVHATKNRISKGSASFATINIENLTVLGIENLELAMTIPNGLN